MSRARTATLCLLLALLLLGAGCGTGDNPDSQWARVTLRISGGDGEQAATARAAQAAGIPAAVRTVRVTVSGPGMEPIEASADVTDASAVTITLDVPVGPQRLFTVTALDENGEVLYLGTAAEDVFGEGISLTVTMDVVVQGTVATPTLEPAGGIYLEPQRVTITTETPEAQVYYTTDGTAPAAQAGVLYAGPFEVAATATVRAIAVREFWLDSAIAEATYTITGTVAAPTFDPPGGTYTTPQSVTLATATPGAEIYYTTDGSAPSADNGQLYTEPFSIGETTTVRAVSVLQDWASSDAAQAIYTLQAVTPSFDPPAGTYASTVSITVSTTTAGAQIRYTTDGSDPQSSTNSTLIPGTSGTVSFTATSAAVNSNLRAVALRAGWANSTVASAAYTVLPPLAPPTFVADNVYVEGSTVYPDWWIGEMVTSVNVDILSPTPGAQIRYTIDGSTPTATDGIPYDVPVPITDTTTLRAIAYLDGWADSTVSTVTYSFLPQVSGPSLDLLGGTYTTLVDISVTLSTVETDAIIRYTLDGTDPRSSATAASISAQPGAAPSGSVTLPANSTTTIRASTSKPGFADSWDVTQTYILQPPLLIALGSVVSAASAVDPQGGTGISVARIAGGDAHTVALTLDGRVWAWGRDAEGALGVAAGGDQVLPVPVSLPVELLEVSAGDAHTSAVASNGTVWAWGVNQAGQLGDGTLEGRITPIEIPGVGDVVGVASGAEHSLAVRRDGSAWAWGANASGQLGVGDTANRALPARVSGLARATALAAGASHSLALASGGSVWVWGGNDAGQLGVGDRAGRTLPVQLEGLPPMVDVAAGDDHSLALARDGTLWAWGGNTHGQLGLGDTVDRPEPHPLPGLEGILEVTAGTHFTLALTSSGTVWAWGRNDRAQLGLGDTEDRPVPVPVTGLPAIVDVVAGGRHAFAVGADGTVWAWGANEHGQLGTGDLRDRPLPVRIQ